MRWAWSAIATIMVLGAVASPAAAMPDWRNAKPRILSAELVHDGLHATISIVGRDRDDVVRGADVKWGDDQPAQGLSACSLRSGDAGGERRRGSRERFEFSYDYPAAGDHTISVRVFSGGCGKCPMQRSVARTLNVHVG
jgi:hypothetical protein